MTDEKSVLRGADARITSLADLSHSLGTVTMATVTAGIFAILILIITCEWWPKTPPSIMQLVIAEAIAIGVPYACHKSYERTYQLFKGVFEQILDDALGKESQQGLYPIEVARSLPNEKNEQQ